MIRIVWAEPSRPKLLDHISDKKIDHHHWVTATGKRIRISRMGDGHLVNTALMLMRKAPRMRIREHLDLSHFDSFVQGEATSDAINSEINNLMEMSDDEWLDRNLTCWMKIKSELRKRRLMDIMLRQRAGALDHINEDDVLTDPWGNS